MKQATSEHTTTRQSEHPTQQDASAGPNGISIAPPAYGIDFVDRDLMDTVPVQRSAASSKQTSETPGVQQKNKTGLPDGLKAGVESLSGLSMDDVKVHYNSSEPAQLQALAYTQGTDIHVGPGQERHLAHEAWHVVQQKQGRVKPSIQFKGINVNVDPALEKEAAVMGARANNLSSVESRLPTAEEVGQSGQLLGQPVQRKLVGEPVRQFQCGCLSDPPPTLQEVIDTERREIDPARLANQVSEISPAFRKLRARGDQGVREIYERDRLRYEPKPKKGYGWGPAYFKDGVTYYDEGQPGPQAVLNIVFETANAVQSSAFKRVENDYESKILMDEPMSKYLDLELFGSYDVDNFHDAASKRSLIQEGLEWNSFKIATDALVEVSEKYTGEVASITWDTSFGAILACEDFSAYYELKGRGHRAVVEENIRKTG